MKNKIFKIITIIIICLMLLLTMAFGTYKIIQYIGAINLQKKSTSVVPELMIEETISDESVDNEIEEEPLKEGEVIYKGHKYSYNKDIRTFVILGIDTMGDMDALLSDASGGQSDMIFMAVLDPHKKAIELIGINRNTMTEVWRYDTNGDYVDTVVEQITLQHAYLSGGVDSCEATVAAIDKLMYMVPIHGYFSMNMGAISKLNDAIGGVELIPLESIPGTKIKKDQPITLMGQNAFQYTKYRDWTVAYTADDRLERQKQYLNAFVHKTMSLIKDDLSVPLNLFNIISNYAVTDITIDQMTYLVSQAINYSFDMGNIYSIPGKTIQSDNTEYEEFYVDEEKLHEMIIDIFYEPVEE